MSSEIITLADGITDSVWTAQTDVCCHWCCHSFTSIPMKLPYKKMQNGRLRCQNGPFCSLNCAKASATRLNVDPGLLHMLWSKIDPHSHVFTHRIFSAPPWQSLKKFGGPLTIDEFRDGFVMFPMTRAPPRREAPVFSRRDLVLVHSDVSVHVELLQTHTHVDQTRLSLTRKPHEASSTQCKYKRTKCERTTLDAFLAQA